jgi:glutathione synthetase
MQISLYLTLTFLKVLLSSSATVAALAMPEILKDIPLDTLAAHANSYASANGIQVERRREDGTSYFECAPMSLLPNAYPQQAFEHAESLATSFNELVDRISRDSSFLEETLEGVIGADPYTAKLLQLYKQVYGDPDSVAHTADRLGIHRSDYMLHKLKGQTEYSLKQVELNTIAASFAGLSCNVASLHRYLTSRFAAETDDFLSANQKIVSSNSDKAAGVPQNPALQRIPKAMSVAFSRYAERFCKGDASNLAFLFVVQEGEANTVDQRMLEFHLWEDYQIPVVRMSLTKAATQLTRQDNGALYVDGQEIAVVYYRAGYAPTDYPDGDDGIEWKSRLLLENSRAAKCPSLGYHLAGTKKVQQELARPGVVERFFPSDAEKPKVDNMRSAFAGLYSLGDDMTLEDITAVKECLEGKQGMYVLKPQREGGGYNFYGDILAEKLKSNIKQEGGNLQMAKVLAEFILMERLFPPQQRAVLLRNGKVEGSGESVSELGCYGTLVVAPDGKVAHNEYAGFLLRTKFSNVDEGGVASGFATLSSPYLC